jgi:hypothetical protein
MVFVNQPTWVPPGHFYSPLVDPSDPHVRQLLERFETSDLPADCGITIDDAAMLRQLDRLSGLCREIPFHARQTPALRYFYENSFYGYGDAAVYFGMICDLRPKRIIEIGSGFSSALAMDTNDRFFERAIDLTFIEPYPETLLKFIGSDRFYAAKLIQKKLQDVPVSLFGTLEENDILFIDSSHVAKMASDVNHYFLRVLPALAAGVVIHIHDIPYPFEYFSDWIDKENRSWNEAYMLRSFLQYNSAFQVIYFNHYMFRKHIDSVREKMPICLLNCGASIWLRKVI